MYRSHHQITHSPYLCFWFYYFYLQHLCYQCRFMSVSFLCLYTFCLSLDQSSLLPVCLSVCLDICVNRQLMVLCFGKKIVRFGRRLQSKSDVNLSSLKSSFKLSILLFVPSWPTLEGAASGYGGTAADSLYLRSTSPFHLQLWSVCTLMDNYRYPTIILISSYITNYDYHIKLRLTFNKPEHVLEKFITAHLTRNSLFVTFYTHNLSKILMTFF